jgi:hypothetical protein
MKIDNILESINRAIDYVRDNNNIISVKGHFVALTTINKGMGSYKECNIQVNYIDIKNQKIIPFCNEKCIEKCVANEEHKLIDQTTSKLITAFFIKWNECSNDIINGLYGNK